MSEIVTDVEKCRTIIHSQKYDPIQEELQQEHKYYFFRRMKSTFSNGGRVSEKGLFLLARKENQYV